METPPSSTPSPARRPSPQRLDVPIRFRALARKNPAAAENAVALDRRMQAIARRAAAERDARRREPLLRELVEARIEIDALVATAMGEPLPTDVEPSALAMLPPQVRALLAKLLGVGSGPEFAPLLERKAAEWIEQGRAFDEIATEFGFVAASTLGVHDGRGALALTHNGSLVQMSAASGGRRKFVYQSLYVNAVPTEGELEMKEALHVGERLRTTAMDTSAVRKLRVAARPRGEWSAERRTFDRLSTILTRPTAWGARASLVPSLGHGAIAAVQLERARVEAATHRARVELAGLVEQLAFERVRRDTIDVELLGLVLHLQELAVESGAIAHAIDSLARIVTERGEVLVIAREEIVLERPGKSREEHPPRALASQRAVIGAPLALCDERGAIAALVADVVRVEPR